jgi:hypothetical protein
MGAQFSTTTTTRKIAGKTTLATKRKKPASPTKLRGDKVAHGVRLDENGTPRLCLFETRFDAEPAFFQLRKSNKTKSDFTDTARSNLMREYAVASAGGSTTGSRDSVLAHYTTTIAAIDRWRKALAAKASTNGDKANCAMSASIEITHEDSLPKKKPCPDKENRHPNKNIGLKSTPPPKKMKTPKQIKTPKKTPTSQLRLTAGSSRKNAK